MKKLIEIQSELKVGKTKYNKFGGYKYRSLEDILDALKPLLSERGLLLTINDEIKSIGEFTYIESIVRVEDSENKNEFVETRALAGIDKTKGKMDLSQIFGSASSYARKYAMNGMFLIDDSQDADTEAHNKMKAPMKANKKESAPVDNVRLKGVVELIKQAKTKEELSSIKKDNIDILSHIKIELKNRYENL